MRYLLLLALIGLVVLAVGVGWCAWLLTRPLPVTEPAVVEVERGASLARTLRKLEGEGLLEHPELLRLWGRVSGSASAIHAGEYRIEPGITAIGLLDAFVAGRVMHRHFTLVEGWRFDELRKALARAPRLENDSADLSDDEIMKHLGRAGVAPEGRFFPDTYAYLAGDSDLALLRRAMERMDRMLDREWSARSFGLPLESPEEALILASLVEKETGHAADRAKVAAVFVSRLERGMRLQTDPTVIYALGEAFSGVLTRSDLRTPSPWNTYMNHGLPPTPIAMPGLASLQAALHPAETDALYFVARGDGRSHFSTTLEEHNRAVYRYLRGGRGDAAGSER